MADRTTERAPRKDLAVEERLDRLEVLLANIDEKAKRIIAILDAEHAAKAAAK